MDLNQAPRDVAGHTLAELGMDRVEELKPSAAVPVISSAAVEAVLKWAHDNYDGLSFRIADITEADARELLALALAADRDGKIG
ncbi:hypothetical protein [Caulobacter sp. RHG1]|uniref:hypothetical protein n=1 Tax=Caulobacter sp. (strain RHG1) TaxID=2545762 RepID=UPI001553FC58|nr:hypothetical protein [Caulobacter sp. RHG1]